MCNIFLLLFVYSTHHCFIDITQAIQDITSVKSRQKNLAKKVNKKREITPRDVMDSGLEERVSGMDHLEADKKGLEVEEGEVRHEDIPVHTGVVREDVPDGAQISKAFDTLCNIVRDRMRKYKKPEPIADFYTKGRYVLVTGDSNYIDPCFYTSSPSGGHVFVTIWDGMMPPYDPYAAPSKPSPTPGPTPRPLSPSSPSEDGDRQGQKGNEGRMDNKRKGKEGGNGGKANHKSNNGDANLKTKDVRPTSPNTNHGPNSAPTTPKNHNGGQPGPRNSKNMDDSNFQKGLPPMHFPRTNIPPDSMSYEKVEVMESVEKLSPDNKVKGYEETAMVVETMIEKTSKKKHGDRT